MTTFDALDNPIWESLTSIHANKARSNGSARRYANQVSPLAAVSKPTPTKTYGGFPSCWGISLYELRYTDAEVEEAYRRARDLSALPGIGSQ